jgi:hypothetical protein
MDPDVAALMGFGGFRSSNKKWYCYTYRMSCVWNFEQFSTMLDKIL